MDVTGTSAVVSDVVQNKIFILVDGTVGVGTGTSGGSSLTHHTIHLEFTDSTDTDIDVYYDDSFISSIITSYTPTTYGAKTIDSASLDNVVWYTRPTEIWETIWDAPTGFYPESDPNAYPYCWISDLSSISITVGSRWRVTFDNVEYLLTATSGTYGGTIGNPIFAGGSDDGSGVPCGFFNAGWGAWSGAANVQPDSYHSVKIERLVS